MQRTTKATFTRYRTNFRPVEKLTVYSVRTGAIFLLCSHGIDVPDEILTFVSGLTSCSCAEGYFQDPKWRQKRERLTIEAMRPKIRHLKALKEINILHG